MIDTAYPFPQTEMVGAYGEQLLSWLNTTLFPPKSSFKTQVMPKNYNFYSGITSKMATTALIFCTVHPESLDALFEAAHSSRCA